MSGHLLHYSYMGLNGADDFVAALALDEDGMEAFAAGAPLSTDDRNYMATHSRSLGDGLNAVQLSRLFQPYDPLLDRAGWIHRELADELNFVYIATRLLASRQYERAARLADTVSDPSTRALIAAIGFDYSGQTDQAQAALRQALLANPDNVDAQFQLVSKELANFVRGGVSAEARAVAARLTGAPAAVVRGWPIGAARDWAGLAALDDELARSDVTDIWYPETVQLRADWRTKVLDERRYPFDALRMVDRALVISPTLDLYVLRAAAASALEDDDIFVESAATCVPTSRTSSGEWKQAPTTCLPRNWRRRSSASPPSTPGWESWLGPATARRRCARGHPRVARRDRGPGRTTTGLTRTLHQDFGCRCRTGLSGRRSGTGSATGATIRVKTQPGRG